MQSNWPKGDRNKAPLDQATLLPTSYFTGSLIVTAMAPNFVPSRGLGVRPPCLPLGPWHQHWEMGSRSALTSEARYQWRLLGMREGGSGAVLHGHRLWRGDTWEEKSIEIQAVAQLRKTRHDFYHTSLFK